MQVGHKNRAYSRGGSTTIANSVCLCYTCNKLQGTKTWASFKKAQAKAKEQGKIKTRVKSKKRRSPMVSQFGIRYNPKSLFG